VLTYAGSTKVVSKQPGLPQPVYNLEVKDYHNFLVTGAGVVVHNTPNCIGESRKLLDNLGISKALKNPGRHAINDGPDASKIKTKFGKDPNKKIEICFDDTGMPDFSEYVATINGFVAEVVVENLAGNHTDSGDYQKAAEKLCSKIGIPFQHFHGPDATFAGRDGIKWTWHHHQDGKTMQLVPTDINQRTSHVGGAIIIEKGGKGIYPSPNNISKRGCF
jgi:hypothetical protein